MKKILLALLLLSTGLSAATAIDMCSRIAYTGTAGSVSYPSGVQGTSMVYLTGPATVTILNPAANTQVAHYFFSNLSYASAGATPTAFTLATNTSRTVDRLLLKYLHVYFPAVGATTNGVKVEVCY